MASIGITLFSAVIYIGVVNAAFVNVQCKTENVGRYGQKSLLECFVKTSQDVAEPQIRVVSWKKEGVEEALLVFYRGDITRQQRGYSFAEPSWSDRNMNVSLLISNTAVQHQGVYTCEVATNSGGGELGPTSLNLNVTAEYSAPAIISKPETITRDTDGTLVCNSDGGYPEGQLRWFNEHNEWKEAAEREAKQSENGLFHLSSKLMLQRGSISSKYTCAVFNASGGKEEEVLFNVSDALGVLSEQTEELGRRGKPDLVTRVVAPLVVIGAVIAGLLMALLCYRRRVHRHHQEVRTCDVEEADSLEMNKKYQDEVA